MVKHVSVLGVLHMGDCLAGVHLPTQAGNESAIDRNRSSCIHCIHYLHESGTFSGCCDSRYYTNYICVMALVVSLLSEHEFSAITSSDTVLSVV